MATLVFELSRPQLVTLLRDYCFRSVGADSALRCLAEALRDVAADKRTEDAVFLQAQAVEVESLARKFHADAREYYSADMCHARDVAAESEVR